MKRSFSFSKGIKRLSLVIVLILFTATRLYSYDYIIEVDGLNYGISYHYDYSINATVYDAALAKYSDTKYSGDVVIRSHVLFDEHDVKVTYIANSAFKNCEGLRSVTIPYTVKYIGEAAFKGCTNMQALFIEDITQWCNMGFGYDGANPLPQAHYLYYKGKLVENLVIPSTVTSIGFQTFNGCHSLKSLTLPETVTVVNGDAFKDCIALETVDLGPSTQRVLSDAFYDCTSLKTLTVPPTLNFVGDNAFLKCSALERVNITDLEAWMNIDFDYTYTSTFETNPLENAKSLYLNGKELTTLVVPESITEIKNYVFRGYKALKQIVFHKNVTKIASRAFYHCEGLEYLVAYMEKPVSLLTETGNTTHIANIIAFVPEGKESSYRSSDKGIWQYCKYGNMIEPYDDLAPVVLSVDDYTRTYGDENPKFVHTVERGTIVSGQPEIVCEATPKTGITGSYDRSKHDIKLTRGTISNSKVYCRSAKLSITKAPLTISVGDYTRLEGKANPKFELTYSGFKNDDNTSVFTNYPKATTIATKTSAPGIYEIKVYNATAANYDITFQNGTLTVLAKGDANCDMKVDLADVLTIVNHISGKDDPKFDEKAADANGDGKVDIADIIWIINSILN